MVKYENSKIYKLWSPSKNIVYIGSTTQSLSRRLAKHLSNYKAYNNDNTKTYFTSYLVLDCEDYKIELLEKYACNNRQQLERKEGEYIKANICVNKVIAGRTQKEYYETNIEKITEYTKKYSEDNKAKIKEYAKNYREQNKDKRKEYDAQNKDKKKEYQKKYRDKKRLMIL